METMKAGANPETPPNSPEAHNETALAELIPLFRILLQAPPKGHDCKTCPTCKKYGIAQID